MHSLLQALVGLVSWSSFTDNNSPPLFLALFNLFMKYQKRDLASTRLRAKILPKRLLSRGYAPHAVDLGRRVLVGGRRPTHDLVLVHLGLPLKMNPKVISGPPEKDP